MIDSTHLKAHRTAASLLTGEHFPHCFGRTKGGLNPKLHAACDGEGLRVVLLLTEGQMNDHRGAALMLLHLPPVREVSPYPPRPIRRGRQRGRRQGGARVSPTVPRRCVRRSRRFLVAPVVAMARHWPWSRPHA